MTETEAKAAGQKLLFNKWDVGEVKVIDPSLIRYVTLTAQIIPHSCGKFSRQEFGKSNMMIVERLINRLMQTENNTGKKQLAIRIVRDAFEIINKKTKRNPIDVLVEAIANAGPREETVRLKYGGINVPKSVDTAPMRRVDTAIGFLAEATLKGSSTSKKSASAVLADELIAASKGDMKCFSVGKKEERERIAKSAR
ncbi:MAG: 30S ribosomal protein S7 [Methanomicrobiales archaeon HGW-Methanomicrobiales-1]|jgi:small subunit ribosomal protein S7|nr:MAG: 30S ribosomal protein S7 [Methanomicrobiales archaeon HGW-Methanomicrobiales-1]